MKALVILFWFLTLVSSTILSAERPSGSIIGWGETSAGVVTGIPNTGYATSIVALAEQPVTDAVSIAASDFHALALRKDGTVVGWGSNQRGQATGSESQISNLPRGLVAIEGRIVSNVVAIAAANFSLALKEDGTIVAWGENKAPNGLSNVVAIAARGFDTLALKRDHTLVGWQSFPWGLKPIPESLSNVVAISVGGGGNLLRYLALKTDGKIVAWGTETSYGDLAPPGTLSNVTAVAAGYNHSLALRKDGTVFGWGFNDGGQATGVPSEAGKYVSSGPVTLGGQVLSSVIGIAAGKEYSLALRSDGTVVAWGKQRSYRPVPAGLTNVVGIAAGEGFCLAISTNSSGLGLRR